MFKCFQQPNPQQAETQESVPSEGLFIFMHLIKLWNSACFTKGTSRRIGVMAT